MASLCDVVAAVDDGGAAVDDADRSNGLDTLLQCRATMCEATLQRTAQDSNHNHTCPRTANNRCDLRSMNVDRDSNSADENEIDARD